MSDRPTSPSGAPTVDSNPALRALVVAQSFDFVIPHAGGSLNIAGVYTLDFPANAVCDPNSADTQAGYAAAEWDSPCTTTTSDTPIRATVKYSNGALYVDFQPALRFNPATEVTLSTQAFAAVIQFMNQTGLKYGSTIAYASGVDAPTVADALGDPSVQTKVNGSTGNLSRRIKHFSGYVAWGQNGWEECDPLAGNPLCVWVEDED